MYCFYSIIYVMIPINWAYDRHKEDLSLQINLDLNHLPQDSNTDEESNLL